MHIEKITSSEEVDPVPLARRNRFVELLHRRRWFAVFVILPLMLSTFYYAFIASDVYVSESRFVIKSPGQRQVQLSALANLIQTTGLSTGQEQANEILDYLKSRTALADLQKRVDVRSKFMTHQADFLSRFPAPWDEDAFEDLHKYFTKHVSVTKDGETSALILRVDAFSPKDAHEINAKLLGLSEELVNRLNQRAQDRAIAESRRRVAEAENRVRAAHQALSSFRNAQTLIDPGKQAAGVLEVTNRLVAEQTMLMAQLETIQRTAPRNPAIPALRDRIRAINAQIASQTGRAVGSNTGIASKLGEYENRATEQEFATQMLTAANTALEQSRAESQKQEFYLERIVEPNTPDLPTLPHRITQILTVLAVSMCLYMIGWMLIVGILEHSPEG